jgi:hypothetical protein
MRASGQPAASASPAVNATCTPEYIGFIGADGVQAGSDNAGAPMSVPFHPGAPPVGDQRGPGAACQVTIYNPTSWAVVWVVGRVRSCDR